MNDNTNISADELRAFTDLCAEAYRELFNIPDAIDVNVSVAAYSTGTVQITLKR